MTLRQVSLDDKYTAAAGPCVISGPQAIVRLMLAQRRRDAAAGLKTAGFATGYRGSPVGGIDSAMWEAERWLKESDIVFRPAVNEDLGVTAAHGTQQLATIQDPTVDGVFAIWYAKGPGVDRSGDALKHGNLTGSHPRGGVVALFGDDHPGKSSTLAHNSEGAFAAHLMPVIYPADVGEFVRFGLLGFAMSRYSGAWTAMKLVNETIEQTATVDGDDLFPIVLPETGPLPPEGLHYRGMFTPALDEVIHKRFRLPLAQKFWRANRIDRTIFGTGRCRVGIVTCGKSFGDTMHALGYLGIDAGNAAALGVDVYKVGLIWPLEPEGLAEFAQRCDELFVVEEKASFVEQQARAQLYNLEKRPRIVGKTDEQGAMLLAADLQHEPAELALAIAKRLAAFGPLEAGVAARVAGLEAMRSALRPLAVAAPKRLPFFCSGCPHNTSTSVPDGSLAYSGIGCHGMAMWARPGTTLRGAHMGGEGVPWASLHHFTKVPHVFQNIGDGTYFHSGLLAIRQAVASGANITYKVLYNDAVAMTGGQPVDGSLTPGMIVRQLLAEGVKRVVVVSDDPTRWRGTADIPSDVPVEHRDELDRVQREMRETPGCTAIVYEQTCAAEKRRRRKRGRFPDPARRMFINEEVCEGCGDCSVQSSCVSIEPLETALGTKRRINQSSCNKDYSCVKGMCPSFVTLVDAEPRRRAAVGVDVSVLASIPAPLAAPLPDDGLAVMIAGIGGTGVLTVGAVLAMAAHLEGRHASVYDMTGMSQKNGAVYGHLRLAPAGREIRTPRVGLGEANLLFAFDLIAAMADESFGTLSGATRVIGNDRVLPTSSFTLNPDERVDTTLLARRLRERVGEERVRWVDATGIALALCGDAIAANLFMVGVALQHGWLPISPEAIERAIELNGVAVPFNLRALRLGRLWAHDPAAIERILADGRPAPAAAPARTLAEIVDDRARRLADYQDAAYAKRYRDAIGALAAAEARAVPGSDAIATAAARVLYKLMAIKDEYEVARLHADPAFLARIASQFEGDVKLRFNLAPPLFARRDPRTGHLLKREYGPWVLSAFRVLAKLKSLRGGALDVFGRTAERRAERAAIGDYLRLLETIGAKLSAQNHSAALALASAAEGIRGYGHVKEASMARVRDEQARLLREFEQPRAAAEAPVSFVPLERARAGASA